MLAETDSAGNWTNYIFFGGERMARNIPQTPPAQADIKYYITDHLHSTAMFVDKAGTMAAILDDNDMYPWGGVVPGVGKTTSNNTVKFTGQYRDTDTTANLDYFGARYYSNTIGRFMSPDWAAKPTTVPYAKFGDPQSLNFYSYVENGPINRIDPTGHCFTCIPGWNGSEPTGSTAGQDRQRAYEDLQALDVRTSRQMATEQGNVPLSGGPSGAETEPQFQFGINRWMYRMDQKIDKVLAPWAQALENVFSLGTDPKFIELCRQWNCAIGIVTPVGGMGAVEAEASSAASALRLSKKLASEAQMSEAGVPMAGAGTTTAIRDVNRLVGQYGGNAADWSKMTSTAFKASDGTIIQTHWYQNDVLGLVVEKKTIYTPVLPH